MKYKYIIKIQNSEDIERATNIMNQNRILHYTNSQSGSFFGFIIEVDSNVEQHISALDLLHNYGIGCSAIALVDKDLISVAVNFDDCRTMEKCVNLLLQHKILAWIETVDTLYVNHSNYEEAVRLLSKHGFNLIK